MLCAPVLGIPDLCRLETADAFSLGDRGVTVGLVSELAAVEGYFSGLSPIVRVHASASTTDFFVTSITLMSEIVTASATGLSLNPWQA